MFIGIRLSFASLNTKLAIINFVVLKVSLYDSADNSSGNSFALHILNFAKHIGHLDNATVLFCAAIFHGWRILSENICGERDNKNKSKVNSHR